MKDLGKRLIKLNDASGDIFVRYYLIISFFYFLQCEVSYYEYVNQNHARHISYFSPLCK